MLRKKKVSLVLSVALSDRETFKVLPDKKQQKNIYDRVRNRLVRQGVEDDLLQTRLIAEIRSELFKLQPKFNPKSSESEIQSNKESFFDRNFRIRGFDVWSEHEESIDPIQQLQDNYNRTVEEGFRDVFCPICHCEKSCCRCHE